MTEKQQKHFYFPAWNRCARAMDWVKRAPLVKGTGTAKHPAPKYAGPAVFVGKRVKFFESDELNAIYQSVWEFALARAAARNLQPDDLRHGCHFVALGEDKPSILLKNHELDRVVQLFNVLADHDRLENLVLYNSPNESKRARLVNAIKYYAKVAASSFGQGEGAEAYLHTLCSAHPQWGPHYEWPYWDMLPLWALEQLHWTIKSRARSKDQEAEAAGRGAIDNGELIIENGDSCNIQPATCNPEVVNGVEAPF